MTNFTEIKIAKHATDFTIFLLVIGLFFVGFNLEIYLRALAFSSAIIPTAPDFHLVAPQAISAIFGAASENFELQSIVGMSLSLFLFVFGPAMLISAFLRTAPQRKAVMFAVTFPLFLLHSINIDWLFIQLLDLDGLPWFLATLVFSAFAVKSTLSAAESLNKEAVNKLFIMPLGLSATLAPLALFLLKTIFI